MQAMPSYMPMMPTYYMPMMMPPPNQSMMPVADPIYQNQCKQQINVTNELIEMMPGYNPYGMNRNYSQQQFNTVDAHRDDHFINLKKKNVAFTDKKPHQPAYRH